MIFFSETVSPRAYKQLNLFMYNGRKIPNFRKNSDLSSGAEVRVYQMVINA